MGQARLIPRPGQDRGQEDALDAGFGQLMHVAEGELDRQAGLGRELAQTGLQGRLGSGPGGYDLEAETGEEAHPEGQLVEQGRGPGNADAPARSGRRCRG
jgi:hypothetical protein